MDIVIVDLNETRDPFSLPGGKAGTLATSPLPCSIPGATTWTPGCTSSWRYSVGGCSSPGRVRLTPQWRGFGLGVMLAGTAIKKLSADARFAACYPAALDDNPDPAAEQTPEGQAARRNAAAALGRTWAKLGFEHFRDGVHVLDLGLVTFEEELRGLHQSAQRFAARTADKERHAARGWRGQQRGTAERVMGPCRQDCAVNPPQSAPPRVLWAAVSGWPAASWDVMCDSTVYVSFGSPRVNVKNVGGLRSGLARAKF